MRLLASMVMLLIPALALAAEGWQVQFGAEIAEAMKGREVVYDGAKQVFYASGRTIYEAGQSNEGNWWVDGDYYCSKWPPSDNISCYVVEVSGDGGRIRFTSSLGETAEGVYAN